MCISFISTENDENMNTEECQTGSTIQSTAGVIQCSDNPNITELNNAACRDTKN